MKTSIQIFLILTISQIAFSQEFKTKLLIENENGRKDSVEIGYDPNALESLDHLFGGIDITDSVWSSFEIRAAQIDVTEIINGEDVTNPRQISDLTRYQTKVEIIPKLCLESIPVSNQAGFLPFITIFIKTDSFPIKIRWNKEDFNDDCVSKSIISDWPITTWWDIPISENLQINRTEFSSKNEININRHSGMEIIDQNEDTLMMLNIAFYDGLGSSTKEKDLDNLIEIKPNPSAGKFILSTDSQILNLFNINGQQIPFNTENNEVTFDFEGILFAKIKFQNEIFTKRIIGYRR